MSPDKQDIVMPAIFVKAGTTVDGGWRLTFDVDQSEAENVTKVAALRDKMLYLVLVDGTDKRPLK